MAVRAWWQATHVTPLPSTGFRSVECFGRADCDAIYGGFR